MRKFERKIKVKISEELRALLHYCLLGLLDPNADYLSGIEGDRLMMASIWLDLEKKFNKSIAQRKKEHLVTMKYHEGFALCSFVNMTLEIAIKKNMGHEQVTLISDLDKQLK